MKAGMCGNWYFIVARPTPHNNVEQPQKTCRCSVTVSTTHSQYEAVEA